MILFFIFTLSFSFINVYEPESDSRILLIFYHIITVLHRLLFCKITLRPIVLAGLTQDVDTIRGNLDKPDGFLYRNTEHIYDTFVWLQNNYMTKHQPKNIRLIPLYEVTDEAYTVYFEEG